MKGAIRDIRDNNGKIPYDLAEDLNSRKLSREIKEALTSDTGCNCLMLKNTLKKTEKSMEMPLAFLLCFDIIFAFLFLFLFPRWENKWSVYAITICGIITMVFWISSEYSNPGYITKPKEVDFL
jgi:glucan phosphoethanolaminetransferase (alkaline phosphatase superfamily)